MEQKNEEYIYLASQAQGKFKELGFDVPLDKICIGRIYPEDNPRESGYLVFYEELPDDGKETCYIYVKAFSGDTGRDAHIVLKAKTKVCRYGQNNTFRALGNTEWRYARTEDGADYEIINEDFYRRRERKKAAEKKAAV